jgi:hypothetical protein
VYYYGVGSRNQNRRNSMTSNSSMTPNKAKKWSVAVAVVPVGWSSLLEDVVSEADMDGSSNPGSQVNMKADNNWNPARV